jgi:hypothetical protein
MFDDARHFPSHEPMRSSVPVGVQRGPIQRTPVLFKVPLKYGIAVDHVHSRLRRERLQAVIGLRRSRLALPGFLPGFPRIDRLAIRVEYQDDVIGRQCERRGKGARIRGELRFILL